MRIISIAFKDLLVTFKDKKALALIILMPIVLILVLGASLSSIFKQDGVTIEKFNITVVDRDGGEYAAHFKDFLKSGQISKMINIKEMDEAKALESVQKGDMPAMIIIPEGYSDSVEQGREARIKIQEDPGSPTRSKIVESLVKSYAGVGSAVWGAIDAADIIFQDYNLEGGMIAPDILESLEEAEQVEFVENSLIPEDSLSAMQYYSAAMLVMYILFVGMLGTASIIEERENKTLMRLMSAGVSNRSFLTGKLLGLLLLGMFDVAVLILFTRFAFNVHWGNSISSLILLCGALIFAASGFALFIATVFKTSKAVDSVSPVIIMVMSFLGGSMFPLSEMLPILQAASKITLNNWALRGYLSLMLNNGINSIAAPLIALYAMGTVFLSAGILRLKLQ